MKVLTTLLEILDSLGCFRRIISGGERDKIWPCHGTSSHLARRQERKTTLKNMRNYHSCQVHPLIYITRNAKSPFLAWFCHNTILPPRSIINISGDELILSPSYAALSNRQRVQGSVEWDRGATTARFAEIARAGETGGLDGDALGYDLDGCVNLTVEQRKARFRLRGLETIV